jgi:hypothetical protein
MATFDLEIHQSPSKLKGGNVETGVHWTIPPRNGVPVEG